MNLHEIRLELRPRATFSESRNRKSQYGEYDTPRRPSYDTTHIISTSRALEKRAVGARIAVTEQEQELEQEPIYSDGIRSYGEKMEGRQSPLSSQALIRHSQTDKGADMSHRKEGLTKAHTPDNNSLQVAIVNDASLRSSLRRNYLLDSPKDTRESNGPEPVDEKLRGGSRTGILPSDTNITVVDIVYEEERHASAMRELEEESRVVYDAAAFKKSTDRSIMTPFLMWGVTEGITEGREDAEGSMTTLLRLLQRVNESLREHPVYGQSGRCTFNDLGTYHDIMLKSLGKEAGVALPEVQPAAADRPAPDLKAEDENANAKVHESEGDSGTSIAQEVARLSSDIFARSKSIIGLFIPLDSVPTQDLKWETDLYWGALDIIFKVRVH